MWLLPSLGRPANLARFFAAYEQTGGSTPGMVLIDESDYAEHAADYDALTLPLTWHIRKTKGRTQGDKIREVWSEIASCAWFGLIGDDNVPQTEGWDRQLVEGLDGWNIVSCNDGWQAPKRIANCWVMSGDLVRELGYIFAPGMHHLFVDDMWEIIGKEGDCWRCLMNVMVRHVHVMKGDALPDATHEAAYGKGFTPKHVGPDRAKGLWAGDEDAFRVWLNGDRHRIGKVVKSHRTAPPARKPGQDAAAASRLARAKSRKVMIGVPIARAPAWQFTLAYGETCVLLYEHQIPFNVRFIVGSSNLPRARNEIVARFLASECTDLLFIDDDMGWSAEAVIRLLASDKPIIGGVGRKRVETSTRDPGSWCAHFLPGSENALEQDDFGAIKVARVGTGFLKIAREVFERMIEAHPEWKRNGNDRMSEQERRWYYRFFAFDAENSEMGEDYAFCAAWNALGGEVWIDPTIVLTHVGEKEYSGSISELMVAEPTPAVSAAA